MNESCTVTVNAANVTDADLDDGPDAMVANYVLTFQTVDLLTCGASATFIHDVQGAGAASPIGGTSVQIEGVVVGDYQALPSEFGGFYLQEETVDNDADPATSEGVFVFDNGFGVPVNPGDVVRVRGTVGESFAMTQISPVTGVQVCSTGSSVASTPVSLPVASLSDLERFEGMLVDFSQTLTVTEVFNLGRFGEVSLSGVGRLYTPTAVAAPGAPAIAVADQNDRSRIILDDGNDQQNIDPTRYPQGGLSAANTLRVGDSLPTLAGVMELPLRQLPHPADRSDQLHTDTNPRTAAPASVGGNLSVASFNVLNFFRRETVSAAASRRHVVPRAQAELDRQKAKEVDALSAMNADIVGLMEIENDAAPNSAIEELVDALNAAMGSDTYSFIDTGVIGTDEIKVALIYKPAAVSPVGAYEIITSDGRPSVRSTH